MGLVVAENREKVAFSQMEERIFFENQGNRVENNFSATRTLLYDSLGLTTSFYQLLLLICIGCFSYQSLVQKWVVLCEGMNGRCRIKAFRATLLFGEYRV